MAPLPGSDKVDFGAFVTITVLDGVQEEFSRAPADED